MGLLNMEYKTKVKRIAIIGPESTGKSKLAQELAEFYYTEWVPEFARFYLDRLDRDYQEADLLEIAKAQLTWEDDRAILADKYLFCDTNLVVLKIWSQDKYGKTDPWIVDQISQRKYDFYLLSYIDIPWKDDPQREHPQRRKEFFNIYLNFLESNQLPYGIVMGIEDDRLACAIKLLENI